jgi:hypothetical protein
VTEIVVDDSAANDLLKKHIGQLKSDLEVVTITRIRMQTFEASPEKYYEFLGTFKVKGGDSGCSKIYLMLYENGEAKLRAFCDDEFKFDY